MLKNYFKIALRNISKHKSYSLINILGLTIGMSASILIGMYVKEELSFDDFHKDSDSIAAISTNHPYFGEILNTPYPLADAIVSEIPGAKSATRLRFSSPLRLSKSPNNFIEITDARYAEPEFFDVFSYRLIYGNQEIALTAPHQIILTEESSKKLFGNKNPIGESLTWAQRDTLVYLEVSGVIENPPSNTSVPFKALLSFSSLAEDQRPADGWGMYSFNTFVLFKNAELLHQSIEKLSAIAEANFERYKPNFSAIPITKLHLSDLTNTSGFTGNVKYIYFFSIIAIFILLIACVNYINLATARVATRSKETGIRKVLGAQRKQIILQFLGESILLALGAFILSISLTGFMLPFINSLFGTELVWTENRLFLLYTSVGAIAVGVLAGIYPSFYLSQFSPSAVLKNNLSSGLSGSVLRKSLVVAQFSIALILIMGSLVIYKQLEYAQIKDLGFEGSQVLIIELPNQQTWEIKETIIQDLQKKPGVINATAADALPGNFGISFGLKPNDLSPENTVPVAQKEADNAINLYPAVVDYNYLETLDLNLIAGRNFSPEFVSDFEKGYVINEKTAQLLGWKAEEAIGKTFGIKKEGSVIGVVSNFHIKSLHEEIPPISMQLHEGESWSNTGKIAVKIAPENIQRVVSDLREQFAEYAPYHPFNYQFLDDKFDALYRTEKQLGKIVGAFTAIAIFIACLGLFGLAAFSAERRTKEIGIRKVLGATVSNIVALLSKDFILLVLTGFAIAIPIAWYAMNQWLSDFAYRIEIGPGIFALAGGAALIIALLTVSWQSIRAAVANPVDSLRSEYNSCQLSGFSFQFYRYRTKTES